MGQTPAWLPYNDIANNLVGALVKQFGKSLSGGIKPTSGYTLRSFTSRSLNDTQQIVVIKTDRLKCTLPLRVLYSKSVH